jgi:hypothetical protein
MISAIRLFPTDNVLVLTRSLEAGETIELGDIRRTNLQERRRAIR